MTSNVSIEDRVVALEVAIKELRLELAATPPRANWLDEIIGAFEDEPAFDGVIRYGRAFRDADRPANDDER